jgi:hypothetical protein
LPDYPDRALPGSDDTLTLARELARRQQARSLELRAAMSLSRLWQRQGKRKAAHDLLAPIFGWFTEGFDSADLQEAMVLKNLFPFHDTTQTDPNTGRTDGLRARLAARGKLPKVCFINTAAEYWGGHAALIHTDLEGKRDLAPSEAVRIYHFAGTQHGPGNLQLTDTGSADDSRGQQRPNSVDYRPLLRAALVQLDRWVTEGHAPPPSLHPRVEDGTAVPPAQTAATFQALPGVQFLAHLRSIARLDFGPGVDKGAPTILPPNATTCTRAGERRERVEATLTPACRPC